MSHPQADVMDCVGMQMIGEGPHLFFVESPEYHYTEVILDDGTGPSYPTRDVVEVKAATKRKAIIEAVRYWRKTNAGYLYWQDGNPFTGVKAYRSCIDEATCMDASLPACELIGCHKAAAPNIEEVDDE